jgi:hypothetical protein
MNKFPFTPLSRRTVCLFLLVLSASLVFPLFLNGCNRPSAPRLTGPGRFHDIMKVKRGMSPNEVRRIMGSDYKETWKEGLQGIDSGRYAWDYEEGVVYFDLDGVVKVVPYTRE